MGSLSRAERRSASRPDEEANERARSAPLLPPPLSPPFAHTDEDTLPGLVSGERTDPYGFELAHLNDGALLRCAEDDDITATSTPVFVSTTAQIALDDELEPITERDPPVFS